MKCAITSQALQTSVVDDGDILSFIVVSSYLVQRCVNTLCVKSMSDLSLVYGYCGYHYVQMRGSMSPDDHNDVIYYSMIFLYATHLFKLANK